MRHISEVQLGSRQGASSDGHPGSLNGGSTTLCRQSDTACPHAQGSPPLSLHHYTHQRLDQGYLEDLLTVVS